MPPSNPRLAGALAALVRTFLLAKAMACSASQMLARLALPRPVPTAPKPV